MYGAVRFASSGDRLPRVAAAIVQRYCVLRQRIIPLARSTELLVLLWPRLELGSAATGRPKFRRREIAAGSTRRILFLARIGFRRFLYLRLPQRLRRCTVDRFVLFVRRTRNCRLVVSLVCHPISRC